MFQLAILLLSVPLQLGLVYFSSGIEEKVYEYVDYVNSVIKQVEFWNTLMNWMKYSDTTTSTTTNAYGGNHENEKRHDLVSVSTRSHRPEQVFLRVGFVVLQIQLGYTGVIIGWRISNEGEPIYEILTRHPQIQGYITEAPQQLLYPLQYTKILHPELRKYFGGYNGTTQYNPLPWLRNLYPLD